MAVGIWFSVAVSAVVGLMLLIRPEASWPQDSRFHRSRAWIATTRVLGLAALAFAVWIAATSA
jgi:uncharacterized membrane protein YqjE